MTLDTRSAYQPAYEKALRDLEAQDPLRVCRNTQARRIPGGYALPFLDRSVRVDLEAGRVWAEDGSPLSHGSAMLVMHHLAWARDVDPEGSWISLQELPEGGSLFFPAFRLQVLDPLTRAFQDDLPAFNQASRALGGSPLSLGQAGARFQLFPKVPLAVALWGADEELPGSSSLLFDRRVHHFAPLETLIGFGYYLAHRLLRQAALPVGDASFWE